MKPLDDFEAMINEINRAVAEGDLELNDYETDFMESVSERVANGVELTGPQDDMLTGLWKKATDH